MNMLHLGYRIQDVRLLFNGAENYNVNNCDLDIISMVFFFSKKKL